MFADRSDLEIVRLMNAAFATEVFQAEVQFNQFGDTFDAEPCPSVTVDGDVATVTGGCTTADGATIEGSLAVTNPLGWDQIEDYRFGSDTVYDADAFSIGYAGAPPQVFDGVIRRTGSLTTYDADITVTMQDQALRSDLYMPCSNAGNVISCTIAGGIELIGVGGAIVNGSTRVDGAGGTQTLDATLQGVDRLTMHRDGTCLGWSIEGTERGMTCP